MEKKQPKSKILMFPWLAHGHIYPFLELAKRLSTRNFNIYLCSTRVNLDSIKPSVKKDLSDDDASIKLVELHVPSSELPPEMHTTKNLPSYLIPTLIKAFQMSSSSFSDIMDSVKPDLLIYDLFQPWAPKLASSKNVPSVYFSTSGATSFAFYHHIYTKGISSPFPYKAIYLRDHEWITDSNGIIPYIKDANDDFSFGNLTMSTDIVLVSSSREVEEKYMGYLSVLSKKRIISTGPLIADANIDDYDDDNNNSEIMKWLSGKNQRSTVYISFGSECFLSDEQIGEIAKGLQLSNANFVWVIRSPPGEKTTNIDKKLPQGFLDMVKERGLIIPRWAPQGKILGHPSISGFVSHCGWNGAMQSMYSGVPVIAMPMQFEQPITARLVVEAGVGVEVERDKNGIFLGEELAKVINKVTLEEEFYEGLRGRAKRLSEKTKEKAEIEMNEAAEHLLKILSKE